MKMFTSMCFGFLMIIVAFYNGFVIGNIWAHYFDNFYILPIVFVISFLQGSVYGNLWGLFDEMLEEIE